MIELNLLPDVKLTYMKAQRTRSLVLGLSALISIGSVVLLLILLSVSGLQKKHLKDLSDTITTSSATLKNEPQINKILTVQNQLESLTALHAAKPQASKLFEYLNQVTPVEVSIGNITIDFTQQIATITGTADKLSNINKYVDTLKYTTYVTKDVKTAKPAFSNVVLGSFALVSADKLDPAAAATYSITLAYNKDIFDNTLGAQLSVPTTTTTRADIDKPGDLFKAAPTTTPKTGGAQ
jgi:hypothetical protein